MRCVLFAVCLLLSINAASGALLTVYEGNGCPTPALLNSTYVNSPCTSLQPAGQILWWNVVCQINGTNNNITAYNSSTCTTATTPSSLVESFTAVSDRVCFNFSQTVPGVGPVPLSIFVDCSQTAAPTTAPASSSSSGGTNATTAPPSSSSAAATTSPPTGTGSTGHSGAGRVIPGATFILAVLGLAYMA